MWKMFGWLGKSAAAALLVSFLAIWTTGYIVNSYVETLIKQYNLPLETRPFALSGLWGTLWGVEAGKEASVLADGSEAAGSSGGVTETDGAADDAESELPLDTNGSDDMNGSLEADDASNPGTDQSETDAFGEAGEDEPYGSAVPDDADEDDGTPDAGAEGLPGAETGSGTGPEARSGAGQAGEAVVTTEEMAAAKEQLSEEDRNKLFAILVSKLPQEEWQTISGYVESGLTESELMNVQQIVAKYLNDAEYGELMEILSKY